MLLKNIEFELDEIIDIEYIGIEDTYDITVEEDHSFIANDFVVHNTVVLNPTIQTIPQRGEFAPYIKRIFKAPEGFVLCARDLAQSELRIIGWLANDKNILDALRKGIDLHTKTAAVVNRCKIEDVTKDIRQKAKCFHPDTEVLTKRGWVKFREYDGKEPVATVIPEDCNGLKIKWDAPIYFEIRKNHCDTLIHLRNESIDLKVTPDHRMLGQRATGKFFVTTPKEFNKVRYYYNAGKLEGQIALEYDLVRLLVAIQADGSFIKSKTKGIKCRFGFTKVRKSRRLKRILDNLGIQYKYTKRSTNKQAGYFFSFYVPDKLLEFIDEKKVFKETLLDLTLDCRNILLDELQYWDGHKASNWRIITYTTTIKKNADIIQAVASVSNRKSSIQTNHSKLYKVSIKDHAYSRGENIIINEEPYRDNVAVITVPSTFILVRNNGKTLAVGQCVNFGFVYGMSAKSFVKYAKEEYGQVFTLEEAEEIRRVFFAKPKGYYMLPAYHKKMVDMARKYGYVRSPLGRKRRLPNINSNDSYLRSEAERQAINFPVQSFSSDLALIGKMLFVKELMKENILGDIVLPLWFIHDAVMFLAKKGFEEEAHKMLKEIYLKEVPAYIKEKFGVDVTYPIESDGKVGPNWADMEELGW